jgi:hypothetical protein
MFSVVGAAIRSIGTRARVRESCIIARHYFNGYYKSFIDSLPRNVMNGMKFMRRLCLRRVRPCASTFDCVYFSRNPVIVT